mmetsp:Transcript_2350/g.8362  ORF Transcript_2350/g.8362 Transcript_2350/m.8362 type:complete len:405 (-) Transcript_2350:407-1621(-)
MLLHQCLGNAQAKTSATLLCGFVAVCLGESVEDELQLGLRNAAAGVADCDDHALVAVLLNVLERGTNGDGALLRELDGVRHDVDEHLLKATRIGNDAGEVRADVVDELDSVEEVGHVLDYSEGSVGLDVHIDRAGSKREGCVFLRQLRVVEEVVDERKQLPAALQHDAEVFLYHIHGINVSSREGHCVPCTCSLHCLHERPNLAPHVLCQANDGVQRCAELVGSVGHEDLRQFQPLLGRRCVSRDVMDDTDKDVALVARQVRLAERQLDGEPAAILPLCLHLTADTDDRAAKGIAPHRLSPLRIPQKVSIVSLSLRLGHEDVHVLPKDLVLLPAECLLCCWVEEQDLSKLADDDRRIDSGGQNVSDKLPGLVVAACRGILVEQELYHFLLPLLQARGRHQPSVP